MILWVVAGWAAVVVLVLAFTPVSGRESRREERRTPGELGRRRDDTAWWLD